MGQETEEKAADTETKAAKDAPAVVEYAESLPMLVKRPQLKGYVGDVGFDPLGFSEILPMDWLREAELKHCRVSMLAFVGMIFTDLHAAWLRVLDSGGARRRRGQRLDEPAAPVVGPARVLLLHWHRPDAPRLGPRARRLRLRPD